MDAEVLSAADRVQAFLVAASDAAAVETARARLSALASEVAATALSRRRGTQRTTPPAVGGSTADLLGQRIDELDRLLHSGGPAKTPASHC